jgi:ATP-binding cassette subfamily A (ABC1) protein 3
MEEADALSDRIAIMNHGEVKCCGSPLYLKNKFGSGYRLTVSKADTFDEQGFISNLKNASNDFKIETNIAREITTALPYEDSNKLSMLLNNIEKNKTSLGVTAYGISSSTIEEVFLKCVINHQKHSFNTIAQL